MNDLKMSKQNLSSFQVELDEIEEKLNLIKLVEVDVNLLDGHIKERDDLLESIKPLESEVLEPGIEVTYS